MDNLTHTLTAVLLARAGLGRLAPRGTALLVLASNLPDADIVTTFFGGPLVYLEYHRHLTHALLAAPLLGLAAALAFCRVKNWRLLPAWTLATIGVLAHIVLDLLNNYGVRIWLPFQPDWVGWDAFMIIEPWLLGFLLLCVLAPLLAQLVGSEIGGRRSRATGRGWAFTGIAFLLLWTGARFLLHDHALETLRSRIYQGQAPVRVAAWPTAWNPFLWRGYIATESLWALPTVNLRHDFDPTAAPVYFKPEDASIIAAARRSPEAESFLRFAQYPVWRFLPVSAPDGAIEAQITDVRFGAPEDGRFQLKVVLDASRNPISAKFSFGDPAKAFSASR